MAEQDLEPDFDLEKFLPYLLNQAAEATSHAFQSVYRERYGMTRTQWRVMANLGKFGSMTARDICIVSHIEKTKVSRAVTALEEVGMLVRTPSEDDRRAEFLTLTPHGLTVFRDLGRLAIEYDAKLRAVLGEEASSDLTRMLAILMKR
ncbi:MarR family transcriptional regulator [Rhizobium ruizarguesonis]|jgi:DNA-binding MarR family transcriptional regulator|uniref:MarR family transcriptional regulator n=3 Tax=Rhizobium TaxID=379 RepID=A0AAE8Q3Y6_9HYPH|nr:MULTISPECIES: MarR family winged helix-turn-helix transcriptional regulator [Rhizobium]MCB2402841.1 MarR family winged helix-turn-helix transcriptional regulator [Rhizobium ruizarguesonis]NEH28767.1 MarR family transcriptional regulator [Rhizobium ruizarguesonis]NEH37635.1 MarR family transcriptional regulator [Rhizobium ruizarguesonis]NEH62555.1 MarR family transcriptional regulator [Rhizobium ruizarguesonis]NEH87358.1 MarR family transcriptional regulator [Rhizobium ruizarguesonis]